MPGSAAALELTATEMRQLTALVRAGTTPQRLVRRTRLILGSAAGLGSRALARQERMSRTTVRRWLGRFATQRCEGLQDRPRWIFPRDPLFLERAGPVLDLYACQWQGRPLWADDFVLSADEKTSIPGPASAACNATHRASPGHARRSRV